jgi:hypothetical protein
MDPLRWYRQIVSDDPVLRKLTLQKELTLAAERWIKRDDTVDNLGVRSVHGDGGRS